MTEAHQPIVAQVSAPAGRIAQMARLLLREARRLSSAAARSDYVPPPGKTDANVTSAAMLRAIACDVIRQLPGGPRHWGFGAWVADEPTTADVVAAMPRVPKPSSEGCCRICGGRLGIFCWEDQRGVAHSSCAAKERGDAA